eukprot:TRINITY_DN67463_c11_g2_i2.p1 TRINITY_DN67463_c11_g2~~TRINITY_DN67463_c11_g2_i2.p1  ORF type:complete len:334 (-),score=31.09 TRINITY_DN67463_c11_g2_i2:759-1760(-)
MPSGKEPTSREIAYASVLFSASSVGMMSGNKWATQYMPLPSTLVILQAIVTVVLLMPQKDVYKLSPPIIKKWIPVAALFSAMLFTSMKSFLFVNVSTILVYRNVSAVISTVVEFFVRGKKTNANVIASEITIVAGCVIYGWGQIEFNWWGFFWIVMNVLAQVAYGNLVKVYLHTITTPDGKELSKYTCSYYNNVLCLPFILCTLFIWGEHNKMEGVLSGISTIGWFAVGVTCIVGYFISTSGFGLQKLVSATTFLVVNNMVKIANILIGILFLNDKLVGWGAILGCSLSLGAGVWYSWEQNRIQQRAAEAAERAKREEATTVDSPTNKGEGAV